MTTSPSSLRIGLLDNACHSLQRGYEMLNQGRRKKEALALKEAIIGIHHGIELSLKQLLVQSNEYLVFENVDEAVRKLAHLRRQPDTLISLRAIFGLEIGKYSGRDFADFAVILARIRMPFPENIASPKCPAEISVT